MFKPHGASYEASLGIYRPIVEPLLVRGEGDRGGNPLERLSGSGGWERDAGRRDECEKVIGDGYELRRWPGQSQMVCALDRWMGEWIDVIDAL